MVMTNRLALALLLTVLTAIPGVAVRAEEIVRQAAVPLDVRVPAMPAWIAARDGAHALYELHLVSYRALPLELLQLDILDAGSGAVLASLAGDALLQVLARPGRNDGPGSRLHLAGGDMAVLFIELRRLPGEALPSAVRHAWYLRRAAGEGEAPSERVWLMESAAMPIAPAPAVLLGPPLRGSGWLAANGLGNDADHRRTLFAIDGQVRISQRYAIDFVRIGTNGRVARADRPGNEDFFGYGAELLAVADGIIVAVHDGMPENTPFSESTAVEVTLETIAGNHIILDTGDARVLYGHLRPGTIPVRPGDRVRRGDVIGQLGNSGNSDAPHLHLQVTDLPAALAAEGLPFIFEDFDWQGRIDDLDAWMAAGPPWEPAAMASGSRRAELPLDGDVIAFPD